MPLIFRFSTKDGEQVRSIPDRAGYVKADAIVASIISSASSDVELTNNGACHILRIIEQFIASYQKDLKQGVFLIVDTDEESEKSKLAELEKLKLKKEKLLKSLAKRSSTNGLSNVAMEKDVSQTIDCLHKRQSYYVDSRETMMRATVGGNVDFERELSRFREFDAGIILSKARDHADQMEEWCRKQLERYMVIAKETADLQRLNDLINSRAGADSCSDCPEDTGSRGSPSSDGAGPAGAPNPANFLWYAFHAYSLLEELEEMQFGVSLFGEQEGEKLGQLREFINAPATPVTHGGTTRTTGAEGLGFSDLRSSLQGLRGVFAVHDLARKFYLIAQINSQALQRIILTGSPELQDRVAACLDERSLTDLNDCLTEGAINSFSRVFKDRFLELSPEDISRVRVEILSHGLVPSYRSSEAYIAQAVAICSRPASNLEDLFENVRLVIGALRTQVMVYQQFSKEKIVNGVSQFLADVVAVVTGHLREGGAIDLVCRSYLKKCSQEDTLAKKYADVAALISTLTNELEITWQECDVMPELLSKFSQLKKRFASMVFQYFIISISCPPVRAFFERHREQINFVKVCEKSWEGISTMIEALEKRVHDEITRGGSVETDEWITILIPFGFETGFLEVSRSSGDLSAVASVSVPKVSAMDSLNPIAWLKAQLALFSLQGSEWREFCEGLVLKHTTSDTTFALTRRIIKGTDTVKSLCELGVELEGEDLMAAFQVWQDGRKADFFTAIEARKRDLITRLDSHEAASLKQFEAFVQTCKKGFTDYFNRRSRFYSLRRDSSEGSNAYLLLSKAIEAANALISGFELHKAEVEEKRHEWLESVHAEIVATYTYLNNLAGQASPLKVEMDEARRAHNVLTEYCTIVLREAFTQGHSWCMKNGRRDFVLWDFGLTHAVPFIDKYDQAVASADYTGKIGGLRELGEGKQTLLHKECAKEILGSLNSFQQFRDFWRAEESLLQFTVDEITTVGNHNVSDDASFCLAKEYAVRLRMTPVGGALTQEVKNGLLRHLTDQTDHFMVEKHRELLAHDVALDGLDLTWNFVVGAIFYESRAAFLDFKYQAFLNPEDPQDRYKTHIDRLGFYAKKDILAQGSDQRLERALHWLAVAKALYAKGDIPSFVGIIAQLSSNLLYPYFLTAPDYAKFEMCELNWLRQSIALNNRLNIDHFQDQCPHSVIACLIPFTGLLAKNKLPELVTIFERIRVRQNARVGEEAVVRLVEVQLELVRKIVGFRETGDELDRLASRYAFDIDTNFSNLVFRQWLRSTEEHIGVFRVDGVELRRAVIAVNQIIHGCHLQIMASTAIENIKTWKQQNLNSLNILLVFNTETKVWSVYGKRGDGVLQEEGVVISADLDKNRLLFDKDKEQAEGSGEEELLKLAALSLGRREVSFKGAARLKSALLSSQLSKVLDIAFDLADAKAIKQAELLTSIESEVMRHLIAEWLKADDSHQLKSIRVGGNAFRRKTALVIDDLNAAALQGDQAKVLRALGELDLSAEGFGLNLNLLMELLNVEPEVATVMRSEKRKPRTIIPDRPTRETIKALYDEYADIMFWFTMSGVNIVKTPQKVKELYDKMPERGQALMDNCRWRSRLTEKQQELDDELQRLEKQRDDVAVQLMGVGIQDLVIFEPTGSVKVPAEVDIENIELVYWLYWQHLFAFSKATPDYGFPQRQELPIRFFIGLMHAQCYRLFMNSDRFALHFFYVAFYNAALPLLRFYTTVDYQFRLPLEECLRGCNLLGDFYDTAITALGLQPRLLEVVRPLGKFFTRIAPFHKIPLIEDNQWIAAYGEGLRWFLEAVAGVEDEEFLKIVRERVVESFCRTIFAFGVVCERAVMDRVIGEVLVAVTSLLRLADREGRKNRVNEVLAAIGEIIKRSLAASVPKAAAVAPRLDGPPPPRDGSAVPAVNVAQKRQEFDKLCENITALFNQRDEETAIAAPAGASPVALVSPKTPVIREQGVERLLKVDQLLIKLEHLIRSLGDAIEVRDLKAEMNRQLNIFKKEQESKKKKEYARLADDIRAGISKIDDADDYAECARLFSRREEAEPGVVPMGEGRYSRVVDDGAGVFPPGDPLGSYAGGSADLSLPAPDEASSADPVSPELLVRRKRGVGWLLIELERLIKSLDSKPPSPEEQSLKAEMQGMLSEFQKNKVLEEKVPHFLRAIFCLQVEKEIPEILNPQEGSNNRAGTRVLNGLEMSLAPVGRLTRNQMLRFTFEGGRYFSRGRISAQYLLYTMQYKAFLAHCFCCTATDAPGDNLRESIQSLFGSGSDGDAIKKVLVEAFCGMAMDGVYPFTVAGRESLAPKQDAGWIFSPIWAQIGFKYRAEEFVNMTPEQEEEFLPIIVNELELAKREHSIKVRQPSLPELGIDRLYYRLRLLKDAEDFCRSLPPCEQDEFEKHIAARRTKTKTEKIAEDYITQCEAAFTAVFDSRVEDATVGVILAKDKIDAKKIFETIDFDKFAECEVVVCSLQPELQARYQRLLRAMQLVRSDWHVVNNVDVPDPVLVARCLLTRAESMIDAARYVVTKYWGVNFSSDADGRIRQQWFEDNIASIWRNAFSLPDSTQDTRIDFAGLMRKTVTTLYSKYRPIDRNTGAKLSEKAVENILVAVDHLVQWECGHHAVTTVFVRDGFKYIQTERPVGGFTPEQILEYLSIFVVPLPQWFTALPDIIQHFLSDKLEGFKKPFIEAENKLGFCETLAPEFNATLNLPPPILRSVPGLANPWEHILIILDTATGSEVFRSTRLRSATATPHAVPDDVKAPSIEVAASPKKTLSTRQRFTQQNIRQLLEPALKDYVERLIAMWGVECIASGTLEVPVLLQTLVSPAKHKTLSGGDSELLMVEELLAVVAKGGADVPMMIGGGEVRVIPRLLAVNHMVNGMRSAYLGVGAANKYPLSTEKIKAEAVILDSLKYFFIGIQAWINTKIMKAGEFKTAVSGMLAEAKKVKVRGIASFLNGDCLQIVEGDEFHIRQIKLMCQAARIGIGLAQQPSLDLHWDILTLAAAEQIVSGVAGVSWASCKSGKDRTAIVTMWADAMVEYSIEMRGNLPNLREHSARITFAIYFTDFFMSHHHQYIAEQTTSGIEWLKSIANTLPDEVYIAIADRVMGVGEVGKLRTNGKKMLLGDAELAKTLKKDPRMRNLADLAGLNKIGESGTKFVLTAAEVTTAKAKAKAEAEAAKAAAEAAKAEEARDAEAESAPFPPPLPVAAEPGPSSGSVPAEKTTGTALPISPLIRINEQFSCFCIPGDGDRQAGVGAPPPAVEMVGDDPELEQAKKQSLDEAVRLLKAEGREYFSLQPTYVPFTDGNCLFAAVAAFYAHDRNNGEEIAVIAGLMRTMAMNILEAKDPLLTDAIIAGITTRIESHENLLNCNGVETHFDSVEKYIELMRKDRTWGTDFEIAALAHALNRPIVVLMPGNAGDRIVGEDQYNAEPIFLSVVNGNHYIPLFVPAGRPVKDVVEKFHQFHSAAVHPAFVAASADRLPDDERTRDSGAFMVIDAVMGYGCSTEEDGEPSRFSQSFVGQRPSFFDEYEESFVLSTKKAVHKKEWNGEEVQGWIDWLNGLLSPERNTALSQEELNAISGYQLFLYTDGNWDTVEFFGHDDVYKAFLKTYTEINEKFNLETGELKVPAALALPSAVDEFDALKVRGWIKQLMDCSSPDASTDKVMKIGVTMEECLQYFARFPVHNTDEDVFYQEFTIACAIAQKRLSAVPAKELRGDLRGITTRFAEPCDEDFGGYAP